MGRGGGIHMHSYCTQALSALRSLCKLQTRTLRQTQKAAGCFPPTPTPLQTVMAVALASHPLESVHHTPPLEMLVDSRRNASLENSSGVMKGPTEVNRCRPCALLSRRYRWLTRAPVTVSSWNRGPVARVTLVGARPPFMGELQREGGGSMQHGDRRKWGVGGGGAAWEGGT